MRYFIVLLLLSASFITSCEQLGSESNENNNIVRDAEGKLVSGTIKQYRKNNVLYAIRNVKEYKFDGKSTIFQKDGKTLKSEVNYKAGKKEGESRIYYTDGNLHSIHHYKNGLHDGEQKKFRQSGEVSSIAYYRKGKPNNQLKEYLINGELKKKYPKIVVTTEDKTLLTGLYHIKVQMSDKTKNVNFYLGKLDKDGFIPHDKAIRMGYKSSGVFEINYNVLPGQYIVEKLDIIAEVKTTQNNYYITTLTKNIAFENRVH